MTPLAGTSYANQTQVIFTVSAAPVAADDAQAAPDLANVRLLVAGTEVSGLNNDNGTFSGTIVFDDAIFDPSLDGQQTLRVRAPNSRSTTPVVREESLLFNVDNQGPVIAIITPTPGELVSGIIPITANISDATGIDELSVVATIAGQVQVQLGHVAGAEFSGLFDTRLLGPMIFPNVIIRARDLSGNQSSTGYLIALDNVPPILSLDSPHLREAQLNAGVLECSLQFDPLGSDSVDDGQSVPQLFEIRGRVEDFGNVGTQATGIFVPSARVDSSSVDLFLLDDEQGALLVDTTGNGVCDAINPLLVPSSAPNTSAEVAVINLVEIASTGSSFFAADLAPTFAQTGNTQCDARGETAPPEELCVSTPATRVIKTRVGDTNVIYGVPPAANLQCLGNGIDALAMNLSDGWVCAALRGADNLGNVNVSPPLRMCIDSDLDGNDGCAAVGVVDTSNAPNCTGTYNAQTNTVDTSTPCVVNLRFTDDEVLRIDL